MCNDEENKFSCNGDCTNCTNCDVGHVVHESQDTHAKIHAETIPGKGMIISSSGNIVTLTKLLCGIITSISQNTGVSTPLIMLTAMQATVSNAEALTPKQVSAERAAELFAEAQASKGASYKTTQEMDGLIMNPSTDGMVAN